MKILHRLVLILVVIAIGTVIDYFVHSLSSEFYVPQEYFTNKIIFGTVIGFIALEVLRRVTIHPVKLALYTSLIVAVLLQTKYFLQGYDLWFVFLFMILHFLMFFAPSFFLFKSYRRLLI